VSVPYPDLASLPKDLQDAVSQRASLNVYTGRLSDDQAAILKWTDQLLANHTLSDAEREDALELLTMNQLSDLVLTVGFYQLVCNFLNTFDVTTDGEGELP
jgi:alkylhydroperoxidase family enzyme